MKKYVQNICHSFAKPTSVRQNPCFKDLELTRLRICTNCARADQERGFVSPTPLALREQFVTLRFCLKKEYLKARGRQSILYDW